MRNLVMRRAAFRVAPWSPLAWLMMGAGTLATGYDFSHQLMSHPLAWQSYVDIAFDLLFTIGVAFAAFRSVEWKQFHDMEEKT